jgi:hypothetical protein
MQPLYLARISRISGKAIWSRSIVPPAIMSRCDFLLRLGLSPQAKVLDLKMRVRCRGCGARRRAVVSVKWGRRTG